MNARELWQRGNGCLQEYVILYRMRDCSDFLKQCLVQFHCSAALSELYPMLSSVQALLGAGSFLQEDDLKGRDVLEPWIALGFAKYSRDFRSLYFWSSGML